MKTPDSCLHTDAPLPDKHKNPPPSEGLIEAMRHSAPRLHTCDIPLPCPHTNDPAFGRLYRYFFFNSIYPFF